MPQQNLFVPTYSHGGSSVPGFPAVAGTATGAGRPISVIGAIQSCSLQIVCTGGTATVRIEASGAALDSTGNPPSTSWTDESGGGYALTAGQTVFKSIPASRAPFWRTYISAIAGATVTSYIPCMIVASSSGFPKWVLPTYPSLSNVQNPNG
jgi:hypothetical protein